MQTATSETESDSRDLSICVHHYTLRAPCPKGQGICKSKTTCKRLHLMLGGWGRRVRAPRGCVGGADFGASGGGSGSSGYDATCEDGTSQHFLYCAAHKIWTSVHQFPLQNHCFIGSGGGS